MNTIEPEFEPLYARWKTQPGPETTGPLLSALRPTLDRGLRNFGVAGDPVLLGRAKRIALSALQTYDPAQGRLGTHVMNHLQGLQRYIRRQTNVLGTPERQLLEYGRLRETEANLEDSLGRPVTDEELADHLGWSVKKINTLRRIQTGVPASHLEDESGSLLMMGSRMSSGRPAWVELIYPDLTVQQKLILDHSLGLHGRPKLSNLQLARRLRVTPGYVSQQKARIQQILDQEQLLSPF